MLVTCECESNLCETNETLLVVILRWRRSILEVSANSNFLAKLPLCPPLTKSLPRFQNNVSRFRPSHRSAILFKTSWFWVHSMESFTSIKKSSIDTQFCIYLCGFRLERCSGRYLLWVRLRLIIIDTVLTLRAWLWTQIIFEFNLHLRCVWPHLPHCNIGSVPSLAIISSKAPQTHRVRPEVFLTLGLIPLVTCEKMKVLLPSLNEFIARCFRSFAGLGSTPIRSLAIQCI